MTGSKENYGQEQLFLVDPTTGGQFVRFGETPEAISLEQNIYLIEVLDLFARANSALALPQAAKNPAKRTALYERYGDNTTEVVVGASEKTAPYLLKMARYQFARATGMFDKIQTNPSQEQTIKAETKSAFGAFVNQFLGAGNAEARVAYRAELLTAIGGSVVDLSKMDRDAGLRPHTRELGLDTPDRLRAILEDPRARFIPVHNHEKNRVMTWLDYLDNPEFPLGVTNQLIEVNNHQARFFGNVIKTNLSGDRAKESIIYELGDYLRDARTQAAALLDLLNRLMKPVRPDLTIESLQLEADTAFRAVCRYVDTRSVMVGTDTRTVDTRAPLRTHEDRWKDDGPGRHKTITDHYMQPSDKRSAQMQRYSRNLTVLQARQLVAATYANEVTRGTFHEANLHGIAENKGTDQQRVRSLARRELHQIRSKYEKAA